VAGGLGGRARHAGGNGEVVTTHGGDRDSGVVATQRLFFVSARTSYVSEKAWLPYDIDVVPY
jgi:hypothetical protein